VPRAGGQWDRRIERAHDLARTYPYASEILGFYAKLTAFQKDSYLQIQAAFGSRRERGAALPAALDEVDLSLLMKRWSPFLATIGREAPSALANFAHDLSARGPEAGFAILRSSWPRNRVCRIEFAGRLGEVRAESHGSPFEDFCGRAFLQPHAEFLAERANLSEPASRPRVCPYCGSSPLAGVLRQEGDGAARSLICSFCSTEWPYLRIACPACDERDEKKMCVYVSAAFECGRVEACESCRSYIKAIDLTKDGRAVPEVDDLAAIPLSLWADEKGYSRIARNIMGL
jgi:formate dehydrogenase maturation protein FdhE